MTAPYTSASSPTTKSRYNSWNFPGGSDGKEFACKVRGLGLIPGLWSTPGGGHSNPLQHSCLENPHGQRSLVGYSPLVSQRVGHDWATEHACRVTLMFNLWGVAILPSRAAWKSFLLVCIPLISSSPWFSVSSICWRLGNFHLQPRACPWLPDSYDPFIDH